MGAFTHVCVLGSDRTCFCSPTLELKSWALVCSLFYFSASVCKYEHPKTLLNSGEHYQCLPFHAQSQLSCQLKKKVAALHISVLHHFGSGYSTQLLLQLQVFPTGTNMFKLRCQSCSLPLSANIFVLRIIVK